MNDRPDLLRCLLFLAALAAPGIADSADPTARAGTLIHEGETYRRVAGDALRRSVRGHVFTGPRGAGGANRTCEMFDMVSSYIRCGDGPFLPAGHFRISSGTICAVLTGRPGSLRCFELYRKANGGALLRWTRPKPVRLERVCVDETASADWDLACVPR